MTRACPSLVPARLRGIVYGFNILDPATNRVLVDYVGQTVQKMEDRERQHRGQDLTREAQEQPWSDLIVGKPFVIEEGRWTAAELDERERFHIRRLRPRYNYVHNLDNPNRIPIYKARRQRDERDRARGMQPRRWDASRVTARSGADGLAWTRRQRLAAASGGLWLALAVATGTSAWHFGAPPLPALVDAVVSASALLAAGWLCRPVKGVRRVRRRRKWALAVLGLAAAVVGWSLPPAGEQQVPTVPVVAPR